MRHISRVYMNIYGIKDLATAPRATRQLDYTFAATIFSKPNRIRAAAAKADKPTILAYFSRKMYDNKFI